MKSTTQFLKWLFTPLFNASLILMQVGHTTDNNIVSSLYYTAAVVVFVVDVIDSRKNTGEK